MNKNVSASSLRPLSGLAILLLGTAAASPLAAQIQLDAGGYSQTFDTLKDVTTASSSFYDWVDDSTINGWYAALTNGDGITRIRATNGPTTRQTTPLSISRSSGSEGALSLVGGTFTDSSIKHGMFGVRFVNAGTTTITSLSISYRGEQWTHMTGSEDRLDFQYSVDATSLSTGTWTNQDALDFVALKTSAVTNGTIGGNAVGNFTTIAGTVTGISIAPGETFWLRWVDFDGPDDEQVLGVDNFTLSATFAPIPEPAGYALTAGAGFLALALGRRRR